MAIKLDDSLLDELGLGGLPEVEKKPFLRQLYEELEKRVGTRLAAGMSDEQLSQFERFAAGDIAYAHSYLDGAKPNWTAADMQAYATKKLQQYGLPEMIAAMLTKGISKLERWNQK